jgi:hypothetical protein
MYSMLNSVSVLYDSGIACSSHLVASNTCP